MNRHISCLSCYKVKPTPAEDIALGWKQRTLRVRINLSLVCDYCARPLNQGDEVVAITSWNENREGEPGLWEVEYGSHR